MKTSIVIRNSQQFESYSRLLAVRRQQIRTQMRGKGVTGGAIQENLFDRRSDKSEDITPEDRLLQNEFLKAHRRPAARDGHSAVTFVNSTGGGDKPYMMVFGGDRHRTPFNDTFLLDLECELFSKTTTSTGQI